MNVDRAVTGQLENARREDSAEGDDHDQVGLAGSKTLTEGPGADLLGLEQLQAVLDCRPLDRRCDGRPAATGRPVRLRHDQARPATGVEQGFE
jgi:hypothetical protein